MKKILPHNRSSLNVVSAYEKDGILFEYSIPKKKTNTVFTANEKEYNLRKVPKGTTVKMFKEWVQCYPFNITHVHVHSKVCVCVGEYYMFSPDGRLALIPIYNKKIYRDKFERTLNDFLLKLEAIPEEQYSKINSMAKCSDEEIKHMAGVMAVQLLTT